MSDFLRAAFNAINRHGVAVVYVSVSTPVYNSYTGAASSTEVEIPVKSYPRHVSATQYNMPNMLGKELIEFYFYAPDLASSKPQINDKVKYNGSTYTVFMIKKHMALGDVVLYKVMSVLT